MENRGEYDKSIYALMCKSKWGLLWLFPKPFLTTQNVPKCIKTCQTGIKMNGFNLNC